jgi:hypothetical protein
VPAEWLTFHQLEYHDQGLIITPFEKTLNLS